MSTTSNHSSAPATQNDVSIFVNDVHDVNDDVAANPQTQPHSSSSTTHPSKANMHANTAYSSTSEYTSTQLPAQDVQDENAKPTNLITQKQVLPRFRKDPLKFLIRLTADMQGFASGSGWRGYETYVGSKILYPSYLNEIRADIWDNPRVKAFIDEYTEQLQRTDPKLKKQTAEQMAKDRVRKVLDSGLLADFSSPATIRFVVFVVNNLLVKMYHQGIHILESEWDVVKEVATKAAETKTPLIFLPCHKSHVDYLVLSYCFYRLGLAIPHVVAGENLNLPILGTILRKSGAFFIKRQWDDQFYSTIVAAYMETLMKRGHNIQAFIEGTRSRIGKLLNPKLGILKIILESVLEGRVKDAIIVPISIDYDKVIETPTYVSELLGRPKDAESLSSFFSSTKLLKFKWGTIDVRFAKPFSLQEFIQSEVQRRVDDSKIFDRVHGLQTKSLLLQSLGYKILADINDVSVVMPSSLVGSVLLTLRGRGVGREELIRRVTWLKEQILKRGGRVADFGGMPVSTIVDRTVTVLKDLIGERKELLEKVYYPLDMFELSFYRNSIMHIFIGESILACALFASFKLPGTPGIKFRPTLFNDASFLSKILKFEFIFKPGGFTQNIASTIDRMKADKIITVTYNSMKEDFDSIDEIRLSETERQRGRENFDLYCFLVWPFVETYWLASVALTMLIPSLSTSHTHMSSSTGDFWVEMKEFMDATQLLGKTLYYEGDLTYFESISKEILSNAFKRYMEMGILCKCRAPILQTESHKPPTTKSTQPHHHKSMISQPKQYQFLRLASKWYPGPDLFHSKLWEVCDSIGKFRREGKTRRDNMIAAERVVKLAMHCRISCDLGSVVPDLESGKMEKVFSVVEENEDDFGAGSSYRTISSVNNGNAAQAKL